MSIKHVRALSLTQPWASLVATGNKTIETRSWPTKDRTIIAIHASKGFPRWAKDNLLWAPFYGDLVGAGFHIEQKGERIIHDLPLGAVVALAKIKNCRPILTLGDVPTGKEAMYGDYSLDDGRFAWDLEDVWPLPTPIPATGALSLWDWQCPLDIYERYIAYRAYQKTQAE